MLTAVEWKEEEAEAHMKGNNFLANDTKLRVLPIYGRTHNSTLEFHTHHITHKKVMQHNISWTGKPFEMLNTELSCSKKSKYFPTCCHHRLELKHDSPTRTCCKVMYVALVPPYKSLLLLRNVSLLRESSYLLLLHPQSKLSFCQEKIYSVFLTINKTFKHIHFEAWCLDK